MNCRIEEIQGVKCVIIPLDMNSKERSKSGKSILLASSHGFTHIGEIDISYNITKKV